MRAVARLWLKSLTYIARQLDFATPENHSVIRNGRYIEVRHFEQITFFVSLQP
jgi:hypothetical protein